MPPIAWAGGAAFVLALACFAYTYAVPLAAPAAAGSSGAGAAAIDVLLFVAFAAHHSLFARPPGKRWLARLVPTPLERSAYVLTASFLLMAVCLAWQPLPGVAYHHRGLSAWPHLGIVVAGVVLTAVAAARLDPLDLAGIRHAVPHLARRSPAPLVTTFPYNLVRHPIYLGWALMLFGVPRLTWSRLLMASLSTTYLLVAVPWEERALLREVGDPYDEYRRKVRWRMLPGIY